MPLDSTSSTTRGSAKSVRKLETAKPIKAVISPPNFKMAVLTIRGTSPYVQNRFSAKAQEKIEETQKAGQQARSRKKREPKDFDAAYEEAKHVSRQGWIGIPAASFRNAAISVCRLVGFKMTLAKMSIFVEADGFDRVDGTPLIKIIGTARQFRMPARTANGGMDIRARPIFDEWSAKVRIRWDADQFSATDIVNLLARCGQQAGIGEGRPDSKESNGLGWGTFEVVAS